MALNITVKRVDDLLFLMKWEDEGISEPTEYSVFREGKLIDQITCSGIGSVYLTIGVGESPFVEVFQTGERLPRKAYSGHVDLNWHAVGGAVSYQIEQYTGSVWKIVGEVQETGLGAFNFQSDWLEDSTTHQFRMLPIDSASNLGTALAHEFLMVWHPDVPSVAYSYDENSGKITVEVS